MSFCMIEEDCVRPRAGSHGRGSKRIDYCDEHDPRPRPTYREWRRLEEQHRNHPHPNDNICGVYVGDGRVCMETVTWTVMAISDGCRAPYRFCDRHAAIEKRVTGTA